MVKKILKIILLFACIKSDKIFSAFPINFFRIYDVNLYREKCDENQRLELAFLTEGSLSIKGRGNNGKEVNVLQIWNNTQDALTMVRGFPVDSEIGRIATRLNSVSDNGIRGHFRPTGNLHATGYTYYAQYFLPHDFSINLFLPFFSMKLKNVNFEDLTKNITRDDRLVRDNLTNDFAKRVKELGGIDLSGWEKTGLGDLYGFVQWSRNFQQGKPWLKNVRLDTRLGLIFPTGLKSNIDQLFSVPFGFDGSCGIFFGGGIDLLWFDWLKGGIDAQFLQLFGRESVRRIKTDVGQTDLLLLAKTKTFKEFGITQVFNIFIEANRFFKGTSFRMAYEFFRHDDDKLWLFNNEFSSTVANTARSLEGWTIHQLLFDLSYDFCCDRPNSKVIPKISLYYKVPFNGKRSLQAQTLSLDLSISF